MRSRAKADFGRVGAWSVVALLTLFLGSCGGSDVTGPGLNPSLVPFVGDWRATSMVLTSKANPDVHPDLIQEGAQFDLNVQPSGQYTAILTYQAQASTEIGFVSVSGNVVTLERSFPSPQTSTATYTLQGNVLTLEGDTEFDFNLDGTPEEARSRIVLSKR